MYAMCGLPLVGETSEQTCIKPKDPIGIRPGSAFPNPCRVSGDLTIAILESL